MKNNAWKKLKKENNRSELNLTVEDIGYVNKVCTYAESHGVGLIETQLLRKDLIGMGLEAKKEGGLLEERLGAVEEFAENVVQEGKREDHKEQIYTWIQGMGIGSILLAGFSGLLVLTGGFWKYFVKQKLWDSSASVNFDRTYHVDSSSFFIRKIYTWQKKR